MDALVPTRHNIDCSRHHYVTAVVRRQETKVQLLVQCNVHDQGVVCRRVVPRAVCSTRFAKTQQPPHMNAYPLLLLLLLLTSVLLQGH
jgi:hypothetical protein